MQRQRWRSTWRRPGSWRATWAWIWWWQQPPRRWPTVPRNNQYLRTMAPVWIYISPFVGKWKWKLILNFTFVFHSCASHLFFKHHFHLFVIFNLTTQSLGSTRSIPESFREASIISASFSYSHGSWRGPKLKKNTHLFCWCQIVTNCARIPKM